jgi:hypothetical protein
MLLVQTLDGFSYGVQIALLAAISQLHLGHIDLTAIVATDFMVLFILALYAAIRMRRIDLITPLPFYYALRIISLLLFMWAAVKVFCLPGLTKGGMWNTTRISHRPASLQPLLKGGEI